MLMRTGWSLALVTLMVVRAAAAEQVIKTIPVGLEPSFSIASQDGTRVYVGNSASATVSVIDTSSDTVIATIGLPHQTGAIAAIRFAITPDGSQLLAVDENVETAGTVSVISTAANTIVAAIPVGERPTDLVMRPDGTEAYVVNHNGFSLSAISMADFHVTTIPIPDFPLHAAMSPDGRRLYVTRFGSGGAGGVSVLDTAAHAIVAALDDEGGESFVHVTPDGSKVYVTYYFPDEDGRTAVRVVATDTVNDFYEVTRTLPGPAASAWLTMSGDGRKGYLVSSAGASGEAVDGLTDCYVATLALPGPGAYPAWDPATGQVFTPHTAQDIVSVIDNASDAIVQTFATGSQPSFITIAAGKKYVSNRGDGSVTVIGSRPAVHTDTRIASSSSASTFGQAVTFTATVASAHASPTGQVQFFDGSRSLGSAALSGGTASITVRLSAGGHSISAAYAGSREFAPSTSPAIAHKVGPASGTLALGVLALWQYSDSAKFTATFTPATFGGAGPSSICFRVGTQVVGCEPTTRNGNVYQATWTGQLLEPSSGTGQMKPGAHLVYANTDDPNIAPVSASRAMSIAKEDAQVAYSGPRSFSLHNRSTGTVELVATVTDKADGFRGDVRNAQVAFIDRSSNTVIGTAYVTECDGDCTSGRARVTWSVNLGSAKSKTFTIGFLVTSYYVRSNTLDNAIIVITKQ